MLSIGPRKIYIYRSHSVTKLFIFYLELFCCYKVFLVVICNTIRLLIYYVRLLVTKKKKINNYNFKNL